MTRRRVLILCTGNSCRSQMAEELVNHYLATDWHAYSAGTRPAGYVHPMAIDVMQELGIDMSDNVSKSVKRFRHENFDLVVTVCDGAAEDCPTWWGSDRMLHVGSADPANAAGTAAERLAVFRKIRDQIRAQLLDCLRSMDEGLAGTVSNGTEEKHDT